MNRETNLKVKQCLDKTNALGEDEKVGYNPAKKRKAPEMPDISLVEDVKTTSRKRGAQESLGDQPPAKKSGKLIIEVMFRV